MASVRPVRLVLCMFLLLVGPLSADAAQGEIKLPPPVIKGKLSLEDAIKARKTVRSFKAVPLTLGEISQVLWAGGGRLPADAITGATRRVTPSAGGLYPLEVFLVTGKGKVKDLPAGVYRYNPRGNSLKTVVQGDKRTLLAHAALSQMWIARAPAVVMICAVFGRTTVKYGKRGLNYVFMEAGNGNQNMCLQAEAIGLHTGTVGAFNDPQVAAALKLPSGVAPLLIVPIGK